MIQLTRVDDSIDEDVPRDESVVVLVHLAEQVGEAGFLVVHELQELRRGKSRKFSMHDSRAAMQTAQNDDERVLMGKKALSAQLLQALQGKQLPECFSRE